MSKENVGLFYEKLAKDKALQEKLRLVSKKHEGQKPDEIQGDSVCQNEIIPLAKAAGFDFTLIEFKEYGKEMSRPKTGELTDDELAAVAGGFPDCMCSMDGYGGTGEIAPGVEDCYCQISGTGTLNSKRKCGCFVIGFGDGF